MLNCRFDREVSVRLVRPLMHLCNGKHERRIPILMYHGIYEEIGYGDPAGNVHTPARLFAEQMGYLHGAGYRTMDLAQALGELAEPTSPKAVAITFDDGYRDFYTSAFPILQSLELSATVFLVSSFVRHAGAVPNLDRYMNWSDVREIESHGIRIGSHSASHPILSRLSAKQIDQELELSKRCLEEMLGRPVRSFSYPYAFPEHDHEFVRYICEQMTAIGYENAVTTTIGSARRDSDRFLLPRLPVNAHDDLELFKAKLEGAYDWVHVAQSARKRLMWSRWARGNSSGTDSEQF